jgi:NIPSNAP
MFFEIRRYESFPGQRDALVAIMEEQVIPFQTSKGMDVVGSFIDEEHPDVFFWIRRFESEEEKVRLYDAVYGDREWTEIYSPKFVGILNRETMQITRVTPLPSSRLQ